MMLDRLPASKMYLHFINMKCFSHTGLKTCLNESEKHLVSKTKKIQLDLHRKLRRHRNLRWPLVLHAPTVNQ
ncbi:hypothetical protein Hanom_Chr02g00108971 [Helianthus anomalus]